MAMQNNVEKILVGILVFGNLFSKADIALHQENARKFRQPLFGYLIQYHLLEPKLWSSLCNCYFQVQERDIALTEKFPYFPFLEILQDYFCLPLFFDEVECHLIVADPAIIEHAKKISLLINKKIVFNWVRYDFLLRYYCDYLNSRIYFDEKIEAKSLVSHILSDAIHRDASDIHIEPNLSFFRIRFRINGSLEEISKFPMTKLDGVVSCLKVIAELDIATKRTPQDGRFSFKTPLGFVKNCRISTCPVLYGEKLVIRLLNHELQKTSLEGLGLLETQASLIFESLHKPQGMILVTGPTGCGKTITLYTFLSIINGIFRNIVSLENPIEMEIQGVNQIQVNEKNGLTFSYLLRTILRQDPDIIMIGEIRDNETAAMAVRAAETGHLVLATLHTNGAVEALQRLRHMGIDTLSLATTLTLVIAQRLVRKCCDYCAGLSCVYCVRGFSGRQGIFELLPITKVIREAILSDANQYEIADLNRKKGNQTLTEIGMMLVASKVTTQAEINKMLVSM